MRFDQLVFGITESFVIIGLLLLVGCSSSDSDPEITNSCAGIVDPSPADVTTIHNTMDSLWTSQQKWTITEEMRFGSGLEENPIFFSSIRSIDVDHNGYLYVLDSSPQEIYVFDHNGTYLRTVGSKGSGPGQFENAAAVDVNENGEIWVMEMQLGKLTIVDSLGNYLRTERVNTTGWDYWDYPGGFDKLGRYNAMVLCYKYEEEESELMLARYDETFTPLDTIAIPSSSSEIERFTHSSDGSTYSMSIPFQGSFIWDFSNRGTFWTLLTSEYQLIEMSVGGTPLRQVSNESEKIPVTDADMDEAIERMQWFVEEGGKIDYAKIPREKPAVESFFSDDEGNLWVIQSDTTPEQATSHFDIFNSDGYFLGDIQVPFKLDRTSSSIVKDGIFYGITLDKEGGQVIVKSRIEK